jgi:hypothetical protein
VNELIRKAEVGISLVGDLFWGIIGCPAPNGSRLDKGCFNFTAAYALLHLPSEQVFWFLLDHFGEDFSLHLHQFFPIFFIEYLIAVFLEG